MKTGTKYTAGPWRSLANAVIGQWQVLSKSARIATVSKRRTALDRNEPMAAVPEADPEAEANARLIAAAPELLEACKAAYSALPPKSRPAQKLAEAISKAEGK